MRGQEWHEGERIEDRGAGQRERGREYVTHHILQNRDNTPHRPMRLVKAVGDVRDTFFARGLAYGRAGAVGERQLSLFLSKSGERTG